ncbi:MAG: hypothetical protein HPY54_08600 [Chthonomonadetes bacterium]|nr:hypothetical protein [Chthonomonadetes bacterium]
MPMWATMRRVLLATAMAMTCALCYPHSALGNPSWWTQAFDRWGNPNKAVMQERYREIDRAIARGDKNPELVTWRAWLAKELGLWQIAEKDY